jgi:uncharacterized protein YbjT (DUF2867 family)
MRIVVTAGTGTVGTQLVRTLVERGHKIRVLSRSQQNLNDPVPGAEYVVADLGEPAPLAAALDGADAVYLLTPLSPRETELGCTAVEAAEQAGVGHVVFQSIHDAAAAPHVPHFRSKLDIIERLKRSDVPHTLISPNNFFQNDLWFREPLTKHGVYPQPFGAAGMSRIDVRDIADAAANALTGEVAGGREYPLVGPDVLTAEETARIWGRHLGRDVVYAGDDLDAWAAQAKAMMPEWLVDDLRIMYAFFQQKGLAASPQDLDLAREVLGREPRSFDAFAAETAAAWQS